MNWFKKTILDKNFWFGNSGEKFKSSPNLSVTVVIPAYNEENFISETIESILNQTHKCEIVVVNDSSTDRTFEVSSQYPVTVITTKTNQGSKSQALNYARDYVNTDIMICVDADTILKENSVENLIKAFSDEDVMVASGFVVSHTPTSIWSAGRYSEYLIGQSIYKSAQRNSHAVLVASGCFFGVRTEFYKSVGFKNRSMAEDMDMTWEAIERGYDIAFIEDAICMVHDPNDVKTYCKQVERWYRGFFQCVEVRKYNLFKSIKLGIVAYMYMFINLFGAPFYLYFIFLDPILSMFIISMTIWFFILYGWWSVYKYGGDYISIPWSVCSMMLLSLVNYGIYIKSAFLELILKRQLSTWIKGH